MEDRDTTIITMAVDITKAALAKAVMDKAALAKAGMDRTAMDKITTVKLSDNLVC